VDAALPAPAAAVLRWRRATAPSGQGTIYYNVYQNSSPTPVATVRGVDHVVLGLTPGFTYTFRVRAMNDTGEEVNTLQRTVVPTGVYPSAEFRGLWITRFEWSSSSLTWTNLQARLRGYFDNMQAGHFNAAVFQVRGQGDTMYPSTIEPWSSQISTSSRANDPVAYAMQQARLRGIEFHAWINLLVIWQGSTDTTYPSNQAHPFWRWTHPTDLSRNQGGIYTSPGVPEGRGDSSYWWLTSGNPELETYLRQVVMDFVVRYRPDGLHWDDRTAMPTAPSQDPVSLARFAGRGNPMGLSSMQAWQIDHVQRMLGNIYVAATEEVPNLLVSGSPFGIYDKTRIPGYSGYSDCLRNFGTDPEAWMRAGTLDFLTPQIYWKEGDPGPNYGELVRDWMNNNTSGRPIWPGSAVGDYGGTQPLIPTQQSYVALTRAYGAYGNNVFSINGISAADFATAGQTYYPNVATVPRPAHRATPTTGQVAVTVLDEAGDPITDCWVTLNGVSYVFLSSADGFCGLPNMAVGQRTITANRGTGSPLQRQIAITAGATTRVTLQFLPPRPSGLAAY